MKDVLWHVLSFIRHCCLSEKCLSFAQLFKNTGACNIKAEDFNTTEETNCITEANNRAQIKEWNKVTASH